MVSQGRRRLVRDLFRKPSLVSLGECRFKRQQFVKRRPQRVDISQRAGHAAEPLGRHESHGPDQLMRVRKVISLEQLGQSEVGDPNVPTGVQEEVLGLDVAVDHPLMWA